MRHCPQKIKSFTVWLSLVLAAGTTFAGCGNGKTTAVSGPEETVKLYKANCVSCHGSELQGRMGPTTDLRQVGERLSEAEIAGQIEAGGSGMPAFASRLTEDEIKKLSAWLASKQ